MAEKIRIQANIAGRVQGVFFRKRTQEAAAALNVSGWVRNCPDGTVEAVFEGEREDVAAVVEWCQQGPPGARVERVETVESTYTGEYKGFRIAY